MLSDAQRDQYARHLLLVEIGERGQERLCAARLTLAERADARAAIVAADYLRRAGCSVDAASAAADMSVAVADSAAVDALAGDPRLREAAAWLAGSLAAVEAIKQVAAVGRATSTELGASGFTLASEVS